MGQPQQTNTMASYHRRGLNTERTASLLNTPRRSRGLSALLPKKRTIKDMIGALLFVGLMVAVESLSWYWGLR